jgi:DNA-binding NarL/FixJ family response regulator
LLPVLGIGLVRGIQGFVHKSGGVRDLEDCIDALINDDKYISPFLSGAVKSNIQKKK